MNEVRNLTNNVVKESSVLSTDLKNGSQLLPSLNLGSSENSYVHLGITNSHHITPQSLKTKRRPLKSESLTVRYQTRNKLVSFLKLLGEDKMSDSMALCGKKYEVLTCGEHIVAKLPYHRCGVRFCPMCASRRANKYKKHYLPYAVDFVELSNVKLTPCLLTLTQTKISGEKFIDARDRLMKSFRKFIRHQFFKVYFSGGLYAVENTVSENGNHCHLHAVVFRKKFIDHKLLKNQWSIVSPGAENLNIKMIDTLDNGLRECIKYISKPVLLSELQIQHVQEILEMKGKPMLGTFGEFRKFCQIHTLPETEQSDKPKFQVGQCCPNCNDENSLLFALTMTENQLIDFYKKMELVRGSPPVSVH